MNEHYENGPEGMPRVERMTDSTIMAVLSQKNVPTIYVHTAQDYASLRLFAHAIAEETLARVPAWPAERTTSTVSELTNDQIIAIADKTKTAESRDGDYILPISFARAILAAAAPKAQARYEWLANRVLACDYGDNDKPGQIGWRIRHNLLPTNGGRQPAFMYGKSIDEAIDAAMKENP